MRAVATVNTENITVWNMVIIEILHFSHSQSSPHSLTANSVRLTAREGREKSE